MLYSKLLSQFKELYEKQDILTKLTSREFLHDYGYSEIHCIDLIGKHKDSNVTSLSEKMSMTRSAISKIAKKLLINGDIESYQRKGNKKEVYYKLTPKGRDLFDEHDKRHSAWEKRDEDFFMKIDQQDLETVSHFLDKFNQYLEAQIEQMK